MKNIIIILFLITWLPLSSKASTDEVSTNCPGTVIVQSPTGTICQGNYVTLNATGCTGVGASVSWYKDDPNSASVASGQYYSPQMNTVGTSTYYAKCFTSACPSPTPVSHSVVVDAVPASPTRVTPMIVEICTNQSYLFEVSAVSGLTYTWSGFPAGSVITPFTTSSNKISVQFPTTFTSGYVYAYASNGTCQSTGTFFWCNFNGTGTPQPNNFTVSSANICPNNTYTYTIPSVANASSYTWQYVDAEGNSLMNIYSSTNTANVFFPPNAVSGILRVRAYANGCESPWRQINVSVKAIPTYPTAFVQSPTNGCTGSTATFEILPVSGATVYIWSYTGSGVTIQNNGTQAIFTFAANASSGNVQVKTSNGFCESGILQANLSVTQTPTAPNGWTTLPQNFCQGQTYTITPVNDSFANNWSYTGNGIAFDPYLDNAKTIRIANDATNGVLSVSNINENCKSQPLSVTINLSANCCNAEESKIVQDEAVSFNVGSGNLKLALTGRKALEAVLSTPAYLNQYELNTLGLISSQSNLAPQNYNTSATCTVSTNGRYYDIIPFSMTESNNFFFVKDYGPGGSATTGIINIYENEYKPDSPCENWIGSSSRYLEPIPDFFYFRNDYLKANKKYVAVISRNSTATYSIQFTSSSGSGGPPLGKPYFLLPVPNSLYDYTFVIVKNGSIVGFSSDTDLSNASTYTASSYSIYGLSYKIGSSLNSYVGGSFSNLQSAISTQTLCAKLSNNTKSVTITACSPSAAPVVSSNKLIQCNNQAVTLTATGCSAAVKWIGDPNFVNFTGNTINSLTFANTTYIFAMCDNNGCLSNISNTLTILNGTTSTSAEAITTPLPTQSGICFSGNAISLTYPYRANTGYQWIKDDVAISGATNATYSTAAIGKYKVQITEGSCVLTSPYFHIKPIPSVPIVNNISIQTNTHGTLIATGCTGGQVNWYNAVTNGNKLAMFSSTFNSPILTNTTNYYADCRVLGCNSIRVQGIINILNPCPQNLNIVSSALPPFQASEYITTSGTINYSTGNRLYKAGKAIMITPPTSGGFWQSDKETVFEAKIEGCQ